MSYWGVVTPLLPPGVKSCCNTHGCGVIRHCLGALVDSTDCRSPVYTDSLSATEIQVHQVIKL